MPNVHFDYTLPATSPLVRSGLVMNEPIILSLSTSKASGSYQLMVVDPQNPQGPFIPQNGVTFAYEIPLTIEDLTLILNTIFGRAIALGMIPQPGSLVIEP